MAENLSVVVVIASSLKYVIIQRQSLLKVRDSITHLLQPDLSYNPGSHWMCVSSGSIIMEDHNVFIIAKRARNIPPTFYCPRHCCVSERLYFHTFETAVTSPPLLVGGCNEVLEFITRLLEPATGFTIGAYTALSTTWWQSIQNTASIRVGHARVTFLEPETDPTRSRYTQIRRDPDLFWSNGLCDLYSMSFATFTNTDQPDVWPDRISAIIAITLFAYLQHLFQPQTIRTWADPIFS